MIANKEKLRSFLQAKKLSEQDFANLLDVDISEVEKLLTGIPVELDTARKFIRFFKAELAQHYIDWETMNIKNPLQEDKKNEKL